MNTPVLLIAWRRPYTVREVIAAIRPLAPSRMYVACDGPNPDRPGEVEKVAATRLMIEQEIDWPCQMECLYSDVNQGCRLGVGKAISWFFDHVEEGIILEDDCVPHPDFLVYCATLLERYRHDTRVWCISGSNFQDGHWRGHGSYYFSRYSHCWGWASWRRCWQSYDSDLINLEPLCESRLLESVFTDPVERAFWLGIWKRLKYQGEPDSWAYRWTFSCIANGGLTALPNRNLVCNVGFGLDATHTTGPPLDTRAPIGIDPHHHPLFVLRDAIADRYTFDHHHGGNRRRFPLSVIVSLKRIIGKAIRLVASLISR